MKKQIFTLALFSALASPGASLAGNIYVSPNGDDAAKGTVSEPLKTIEAALKQAREWRRLGSAEAEGGTHTFGGLVIDQASHSVKVDGQEASLTPKEFDLLVFLATNRGIALSRERILQKVWNYDYFGEDRTVDTHIKMLRSHLGRYRDAIVTVWGIGYKFDPDAVK